MDLIIQLQHGIEIMRSTKSLLALIAASWIALPAAGAAAQQVTDLPERDRALAGEPETLFSVGRDEGEEWEVFASIAGLAFDAAGNLYVLDRENSRVVVIGPDGRFVRQLGQKGEGPGEFAWPVGMTVLSDGRVAVFDLGNGAITLFHRDGTYEGLVRADPQWVSPQPEMRLVPNPGGGILVAGGQISMGGRGAPPQVRDSLPILLVTTDGSDRTQVIHQAASQGPAMTASGDANRREVRLEAPPEFTPRVSWDVLPDGRLAIASGGDWVIRVARPGGPAAAVYRRPINARKVTERDRDSARERRREQLASGAGMLQVENVNGRRSFRTGGGLPAQAIEQALARMRFAETVPIIRQIRTDRDGRIWVQRDGGPGNREYPIDIIGADGTYLGTVEGIEMPYVFGPGGRAAYIETDELGVQRVTVRRMPQSWLK